MTRSQVTFQPRPHRAIGGEDHGQPLGRSLPTQDLHDGLVEKLDARAICREKTIRGGHHYFSRRGR